MSVEGLEILKGVGAQKIHEKTHIPKEYIQAIIHGSFEGISKLQFYGFLSILEREYSVELKSLKEKADEYYNDLDNHTQNNLHSVFMVVEQNKSHLVRNIIIVLLLIFGALGFYVYNVIKHGNAQEVTVEKLNDTTIEKAKEVIKDVNISDDNISQSTLKELPEINTTQELNITKKELIKNSLEVIPDKKVWLGYIDLQDNKHHQKVVQKSFTFNPDENCIIVFGHGYLEMKVNGVARRYNTKNNIRFLYKDGNLTKIDYKEFKKYNKGKEW